MPTRFFRAGVGTVIYRSSGEVAIFRRSQPPRVGEWEFQQGGIDLGEVPEQTLWRELREEVGITEADIEKVTLMPRLTIYISPNLDTHTSSPVLGQGHYWYFLQLKENVEINLDLSLEDEADAFKWVQFPEAIREVSEYKRHAYEELYDYFKKL